MQCLQRYFLQTLATQQHPGDKQTNRQSSSCSSDSYRDTLSALYELISKTLSEADRVQRYLTRSLTVSNIVKLLKYPVFQRNVSKMSDSR